MAKIMTLYMTAANEDEAARIVSALLDERLIACGNILPGIRSLYRWEGKVANDAEVAVIMKTRAELADAAIARIVALHSYDTPCVTAWPVTSGHADYLGWVVDETVGEG
ncbi:MAG: divalent-cation tolerance protein CutA [Sphingomonadales bacterium]|nr:divalent-cation tolerance protein CutA [Sphingomonadales bacterium]